MGRPKKKLYEDQLKEKYNGKIENLEPYVNLNTKILHRCNLHKHNFRSTPASVLGSKHGCPLCGEEALKEHTDSLRVFDDEDYQKLLDERFDGNIICLESVKASNTSIKHFCKKHQYEYMSPPARVLQNKYGCKFCGAEAHTQSLEEKLEKTKKRIFELVGNEYEIVGGFTAIDDMAKFRHNCENGEKHYFDMTPTSFIYRGSRCYCENPSISRVIPGFNDIHTTRPDVEEWMHNKEDAYKYSMSSKEKILWDCPDCKNTFEERICNVNSNRLSCPFCSDGISYPNKFMYNSLYQIKDDLDFLEREYNPDWCKFEFKGNKRCGKYDVYFGIDGQRYIVEMDGGLGHGNKVHTNSLLSQDELLQIDLIKDKLAQEQGIQVIRIDCNYKTDNKYTYILNNVLNSDLKDIIDLSKIDFDLSNKNSVSSLIVKAGELWNQGLTAGQIRKELKIGEGTVTSYLKTASEIGVCDYSVEKSKARSKYRKVYCTTTDIVFESITSAAKTYDTNRDGINKCCKGIKKSSGTLNGIPLQWMYYEDYLKSTTSTEVSA